MRMPHKRVYEGCKQVKITLESGRRGMGMAVCRKNIRPTRAGCFLCILTRGQNKHSVGAPHALVTSQEFGWGLRLWRDQGGQSGEVEVTPTDDDDHRAL